MSRVRVAAVIVVGLAFASAHAAAALPPSAAGWWWVAQSGAAAVPPPPTVPAGGLMVGGSASGATAVSALRFELEPDQGSPVLTLTVASNGDVNGAEAVLGACPTGSAWASTSAGAWTSRPASNCARVVKGARSADGMTWTFNLTPLVVGNVVDVVLQPFEGSNFNLTFNPPSTTTLKTSPKPAPVVSAALSPETDAAPTESEPLVLDPDLTGVPLSDTPVSAPAEVVVNTRAARPIARPAVAAAPTRRTSGLAVLLLLVAGVVAYGLSRLPTPAFRGLGPMTTPAPGDAPPRLLDGVPAPIGGVGRFARPRTGPPPRL